MTLSFPDLLIEAGKIYKIHPKRIRSKDSRTYFVTAARWYIIYTLRNQGWTFPRIGKALHLDHSSCVYAYRKMSESNGQICNDKIKRLHPKSVELNRRKNRWYVLDDLQKAFEKGIDNDH